ncbi:MAG: ABC transporter permease [Cyclobacteriaceae bacterium]
MSTPPKTAVWLLNRFLREDLAEEVLGDLEEKFELTVSQKSKFRAKVNYWYQVLNYLRPFALRRNKFINLKSNGMIRNNIKMAYRSLVNNKSYSAINLLGLTIGITFSSMLYFYIDHELSYDTSHAKSENIYRIVTIDQRNPDQPQAYGQTMPPVGPAMKADFPEVSNFTRLFRPVGQIILDIDDQNHMERDWFMTDQNFFSVFDYPLLYGDESSALEAPFSAVLTIPTARRYFGSEHNALGKVMQQGDQSVKVTGVLMPLPTNSHLQFDILVSQLATDAQMSEYLNDWNSYGASTYIVTEPGSEVSSLSAQMPEFKKRYVGEYSKLFDIELQPLEDIYLGSANIRAGAEYGHGEYSYIYIFSAMGIFILVLACVNYINLMTGRAMTRLKEVGIRKTLGALKHQLVGQFLTESILLSLIAMVFSIILLDLVFPYFNLITDTYFDVSWSNLAGYLPALLVLSLAIALLAGLYPAFYLSRLGAMRTLKGGLSKISGTGNLRKVLVVFQFGITVVLLVSTLVVGGQLKFIQNKEMGFDQENLLVIDINSGNVRSKFQSMKNELAAIPGVESVGVSSRVPGEWKSIASIHLREKGQSIADSLECFFMGFDDGMQETFRFELMAGNYFSQNSNNDSTKILLNEAAVKALGIVDPVGKYLETSSGIGTVQFQVIGVVKNFHFQSLHRKIDPLVIGSWNNPIRVIDYFTLNVSGNPEEVIAQAQLVHEKFDKNSPMEYNFLEQKMSEFYDLEQRASRLFNLGVSLSIIVACLGLFGLSAFTADQRRKEISIRKVLGASVNGLLKLLTFSFLKLIILAIVIGTPIAWYLMDQWLDGFAYRVSLSGWYFVAAAVIVTMVGLVTVVGRSFKVALTDPAKTLKVE